MASNPLPDSEIQPSAEASCLEVDIQSLSDYGHPPETSSGGIVDASYPKVCRNREQFQVWQKSRKWLTFDAASGGMKCSACVKVKNLSTAFSIF